MAASRESKEHLLIKQLITTVRCARCHQHYSVEDVRVVGRQNDLWLLEVTCGNCQSHGWALALLKGAEHELKHTGVMPEEPQIPRINAEDVLNFHEFLRDFDGDVYDLLEAMSEQEE